MLYGTLLPAPRAEIAVSYSSGAARPAPALTLGYAGLWVWWCCAKL